MNAITVTRLNPIDWPTYKVIQLEALKADPQAFGSSYAKWVEYSDEKWQERPSNPDSMIFIAKDENKPIGLVGVHMETENDERVAHIWGMYVNNDYRGRGIGKELMQAAMQAIKDANETNKMKLMVNSDETPAIKLYERMGFKKTGTTEYLLGDGQQHILDIMEQVL